MIYFFVHVNTSYYFFNRQELLQKKATKYHIKNQNILKENAKNKYRNLSEKEKKEKRKYGRNRYRNMTEAEKNKLKNIEETSRCQKNKQIIFLYSIKINGKTLNFGDFQANKKEFIASEQPMVSDLVHINKIVVSDKFKHSNKGFKYLIGYKDDDIIKSYAFFCLKYIKSFDSGGKNMSFVVEDDSVLVKFYQDVLSVFSS